VVGYWSDGVVEWWSEQVGVHLVGRRFPGDRQTDDWRQLMPGRQFCYGVVSIMFSIETSESERLLKLSWLGHVDLDEMRRCAEEIRVRTSQMQPGFRVLVDMTDLESMDYAGSPYIGSIMDLCVAKQVEHVVRVIPNPRKDIGMNIMSYLRYGSKVKVTICENLADAMEQLAQ
jgi:hypothetical protein